MENYVPSDQEELIEASPEFPKQYTGGVTVMKVKKHTKFAHILDHVRKQFEQETTRHVIFEGVGEAADKCISCVEVFKRGSESALYQWNSLQTAKKTVFWEPIVEHLDRLKVTIETPVMYILISKDPFPVELQCLSMQSTVPNEKPSQPSRTPKKRARGSAANQWERPQKEDMAKLNKQRHAVLDQIKADP